jgi:hypothetical protein
VERYKKFSDYKAPGPAGRVGGDLDSWCTKCRAMTEHTVVANSGGEPVQVLCNTCKSRHKYRPLPPGQSKTKSGSRRTVSTKKAKPPPAEKAWQEASRDKDVANPVPYHPSRTFEEGQVILHGKFGIGVITEVKTGGKIQVVFPDATRVLIHARG